VVEVDDGQRQAKVNADLGITREVQDEFAYHSHSRARARTAEGLLAARSRRSSVATKAKGKLVVDALPVTARPRVPAHAGGTAAGLWSHESAEALVPDAKRFSRPYVTGDVPFDAGRQGRTDPAGFDARVDGEAAAAR
jgi:acetyl-CoA acetyltransferase